ncbi:MAG: hypothetical protein AB7O91_02520 [Sphingomonas sp.]
MKILGLTALALVGLGVAGVAAAQSGSSSGQQAAGKSEERLICRRVQDSGSLARRTRQCYTREQWDRMANDQRSNSPAMTAMTGSQSGN